MSKACRQCGHKTADEERFCSKCGYEYYPCDADTDSDEPISDIRIGDYLIEDIKLVVVKKTSTYIDKFSRLESGNPKRSFNWSSALFGANWTGYRKMGLQTLFFILLQTVFTWVMSIILVMTAIIFRSSGAILLFGICFIILDLILYGYLGDWIYWRYVKRKLNRCGCKNRPAFFNAYKNARLSEGSGVSIGGIVLAILGSQVINSILSQLILIITGG